MRSTVDLSLYRNPDDLDKGRGLPLRALWYLVNAALLQNPLNPLSSLKIVLLRLFGARIGRHVRIMPRVNVKSPWHLEIGDHSMIGEHTWIDSLAPVRIGPHVCVSQDVYFCCGNHDWTDPAFGKTVRPITVEEGVWIAARATILPGVTVASHSVVAAGSVLTRSTEPYRVYAGNPAAPVRNRVISPGGPKRGSARRAFGSAAESGREETRMPPLRILVHDYAGHPFQAELSRSLARRGHTVLHLYSASCPTPQGRLQPLPGDPEGYAAEGIRLADTIDKGALFRRRAQERQHGRAVADRIAAFRPDVVLSANAPLDAQALIYRACRRAGARFVFWVQDLLGIGAARLLARRLPLVGGLVGAYYVGLERRLLRHSDAIVLIAEEFASHVPPTRPGARIATIHNWAPIDEVPVRPQANTWSMEHDLAGRRCLLYAGTLGMKHNPALLLHLAERLAGEPEACVVVVSEGPGARWLRDAAAARGLANLKVFPSQPYERLPDVLGSAEILLALLEASAGVFSVPSKVLTYLCAGRPIVMAVPPENLAARTVAEAGAGAVVAPDEVERFLGAVERLMADPCRRAAMAAAGRRYAEQAFDIAAITDRFEALLCPPAR